MSFGLVNIPVKLYPATVQRDVRFHQFARGTAQRVRYRRVVPSGGELEEEAPREVAPAAGRPLETESPAREPAAAPGPEPSDRRPASAAQPLPAQREVAYEDVVKGYEAAPGRYVMLEREEIEALRPSPDRIIEIQAFVDLARIDPVYFEKSYYLAPQPGSGAEKPYALLHRALDRAGQVGIARFVFRTREYLSAVRPMPGALGMATMLWADEVRPASDIWPLPVEADVSERELRVAMQLIDLLRTEWDPAGYRDPFRERLLELIEAKAAGMELVEEEPERERPGIPDLMEALRASVEAARQAKDEADPAGTRRTG